MLKSRNSFFSESNMNTMNYIGPSNGGFANPGNNQMAYQMPGNIQAQSASNSFYQGPYPYNNTPNYSQNPNPYNDYDNRLAKLERSINRLDARITKLENKAQMTTDEINNTLYMV